MYEDDGSSFDYLNGKRSLIDFMWNDSTKTLTIGRRSGSFPGMLQSRVFNIIVAGANMGSDIKGRQLKKVVYKGNRIDILCK